MMMTSWDEIRGKIKHAYDEIESAYKKYVESSVDKVKQRPLFNTAVKMSLSAIPIIGPNLRDLYDNIGGKGEAGGSEEDKAIQILEFLGKLEQQDKEQFDRIAEDLNENRHAIIDAINKNRIAITDLISAVGNVRKDAGVIIGRVIRIQEILEKERPIPSELKHPPKPSTFRGESNIFIERKEDVIKIKQYLTEPKNAPVSIVGEGGIGKSALAFKAIHEFEDMFDVIIPIYFESILTFNSFLLEIAKSLQLPITIDKFEQLDNIEEKADIIRDALAIYGRVLIYADNYETIRHSIIFNKSPTTEQSRREKEDARMINEFLKDVPKNTYVLLTSRERQNLAGERIIPLQGLSVQKGYELFIEVAGDKLPKNIPIQIREAIEEISKKTGGHPLSIEILASTYGQELLRELRQMLEHLGVGVVNQEEREESRHKSLQACFEYSISKLPETHKSLLPKLAVMFKSPFPASAVEFIFGGADESTRTAAPAIICDIYNSSLLRRIDFDDYGDIEGKYRLYHFHPSVRNYLEHKVEQEEERDKKQLGLEESYGNRFSLYYYKLIKETYSSIGTKNGVLSLEHFNIIWQGKDNDFGRAIRFANDGLLASYISTDLGLILYALGRLIAALECYNKALAIHEKLKDKVRMAGDYGNIGVVLDSQGNYDQALQYYNKSLTIHEELKDKVGMANNYTNIGIAFDLMGNYNQALDYHNKSLAIHEELKDRMGIGRDYTNIGLVLGKQGINDQALQYHNKSLTIHEELQDKVRMAGDYGNIGNVYDSQGNYDQALQYYNKALAIHEKLKDRVGMGRGYAGIGLVLGKRGINDQALEHLKKALAIHEELRIRVGMAGDYVNIGLVLQNQGNYNQALDYHNKSLAIHEQLQDKVGIAADYGNIGLVLQRKGNYDQSLEYLNKALAIREELKDRVGMIRDKITMAVNYGESGNRVYNQGNYDQALEYHRKALKIHEELQNKVGIAISYSRIGIVFRNQGNYDQALEYHRKALKIHEELKDKVGMGKDYGNIGVVFGSIGDRKRAIESFYKALEILQEFEEKTGYHHPLIDSIQELVSHYKRKRWWQIS